MLLVQCLLGVLLLQAILNCHRSVPMIMIDIDEGKVREGRRGKVMKLGSKNDEGNGLYVCQP